MNMRKIGNIILSLMLFGFSSCIRDEIKPCPPLQVTIAVKDKNYFNVDKVELEERKSEDLSFREYVPTLYYLLRNVETGEVVEERGVFDVKGDERTLPITFCDCIPHGKYVLTIWGGLVDNAPLGADPTTIAFHLDNTEGNDIYFASDTLVYDARNNNHAVDMERTKGKLIIQGINLPYNLNYSDKTISELYQKLDCNFIYTGVTFVHTLTEWNTRHEIVTKTVLAPSLKEKNSLLNVNLYDEMERVTPAFMLKGVNITMKRNELTVLKYVFNGFDFTIYVLINGNWEEVHGLMID